MAIYPNIKEGSAMADDHPLKPEDEALKPEDFPVHTQQKKIVKTDGKTIAEAHNQKTAEDVAELCVPKTLSVLMSPRNHLSWRNDRAPVFRRGGPGLAVQVEGTA
jgi:hypothetical protein